MNFINHFTIIICLFISNFLFAQIEGNTSLYMISRNNYRVFNFHEDSITVKTTVDYNINKFIPEYNNFKIYNKQSLSNSTLFEIEENNNHYFIIIQKTNENKITMSFDKKDDKIDLNKIQPNITLHTENDIKKYSSLRNYNSITDTEILELLNYIQNFKNNNQQNSHHILFSAIKNKLISLGFNPEFQLNEITNLISESKNKEIIKLRSKL